MCCSVLSGRTGRNDTVPDDDKEVDGQVQGHRVPLWTPAGDDAGVGLVPRVRSRNSIRRTCRQPSIGVNTGDTYTMTTTTGRKMRAEQTCLWSYGPSWRTLVSYRRVSPARRFIGRCPMHEQRTGKPDHHPSWSINRYTYVHSCFSCGYKGTLHGLLLDLTRRGARGSREDPRQRGLPPQDGRGPGGPLQRPGAGPPDPHRVGTAQRDDRRTPAAACLPSPRSLRCRHLRGALGPRDEALGAPAPSLWGRCYSGGTVSTEGVASTPSPKAWPSRRPCLASPVLRLQLLRARGVAARRRTPLWPGYPGALSTRRLGLPRSGHAARVATFCRVYLALDNDKTGNESAENLRPQLTRAGTVAMKWSYQGLTDEEGAPAKDVGDVHDDDLLLASWARTLRMGL